MRKIVKEEGVKGIYRGQVSMVFREIPLFATQFGTYFYLRRLFA